MTTTVIFLTSTGSWSVPADFSSLISIEVIGAGGGGQNGSGFTGGGGGGGGAYAAITSLAGLTASGTVYVSTGSGGGSSTAGGDTWFNANANSAPASTTDGVLAKGGSAGDATRAGGAAASSIGSTTYSGGDGGAGAGGFPYGDGGGGGGAAGPSGAGSSASSTANYLGGAANGGTLAQSDTTQGAAGTNGSIYTQTSDSATAGPGTGGNGRHSTTGGGGAGGLYGGGGAGGATTSAGTGGGGIIIFTYDADTGAEASVDITQAGDTVSASGAVAVAADAALTQAGDTVSAAAVVGVISSASLAVTQDGQTVAATASQPLFVVAPSYGYWLKTKEKNKPKPPKLPEPMHPTEVVIDEAVLRQMEEERLAALVLKAKQDALRRVEELRAYEFEKKPSRLIGLGREVADVKPDVPARFVKLERREQPEPDRPVRRAVTLAREADPVETSPEIRARVISLFRPPEPEPLKVLNYNKLRGLAPRRLPSPDIAKARTISLRRASSQAQHETRR